MVFFCPVCKCRVSAGIVMHAENCGLWKWLNKNIGWWKCICGKYGQISNGWAIDKHLCEPHDWDKIMVRKELESM